MQCRECREYLYVCVCADGMEILEGQNAHMLRCKHITLCEGSCVVEVFLLVVIFRDVVPSLKLTYNSSECIYSNLPLNYQMLTSLFILSEPLQRNYK